MVDPTVLRLIGDGFLGDALQLLPVDDPASSILRLELVLATSPNESCLEPAIRLLKSKELARADLLRLCVVAGEALFRLGREDQAQTHFRRATEVTDVSKELAAHAQLSLLASLASWVGPHAASAEVAKTKRLVHRAGDARLSAKLQLVLAEIATKFGLLSRARQHLATAKGIIGLEPNAYLSTELALRTGAICSFASDHSGAAKAAREAIELALVSGAPTLEVVARSNLGHALLALGELQQSEVELTVALNNCRSDGAAQLGILDGMLQHALATDNLLAATEVQGRTLRSSDAIRDGRSYYGLWHLLTRVKYLYRTAQAEAGLATALDALPHIERTADRNLLERMTLLAAEGLGRTGRAAEGAEQLAAAVAAHPDPPLDLVAEAARVAGRLAAASDPAAAYAHFDRARRILGAIGHRTGVAEVDRDARDTVGHAHDRPPDPDPRPPAAPLAERLATLADLAVHPPLLATELLDLVLATGAVSAATIVHEPAVDRPGEVRIDAGEHLDGPVAVLARPHPTPSARATLVAVERLAHAARALAEARRQERERAALWPEPSPEQQLGLICAAESMVELVRTTRRIAASNVTVLISGETGVGKELFARALHQASPRHDRPFQPFNCATVPRDMIDSQLFGHRRGAFTGAQGDFPGLIRGAAGGTLFLDEIGEMSLDAQPKLLRFLESGEILALGDTRAQLVDVRVVAATNADLDALVTAGRFREDLFYRLNVIHLRVPPLRERREEIPLLANYFMERFATELQQPMLRLSEDALEYLVLYRWPGNVRQLANEVRRFVSLAETGAVVMPEHLSPDIRASRRTIPVGERPLARNELLVRMDQPLPAAVEHLERSLVQRAMTQAGGNLDEAARILGVSRKGLYLKRMRYGFD